MITVDGASFPDDVTMEEIEQVLGGKVAKPTPQKAPEPAAPPTQEQDYEGSFAGRFGTGVADLWLGLAQLGANIPDFVYGGGVAAGKGLGLIDEDFQRSTQPGTEIFNQYMQGREDKYEEGRKLRGEEDDFDAARLMGNLLTGGAAMKGVKAAGTLGAKTLQNLKYGAGFGAATPTTSDNYGEAKAVQTGVGAAGGAGLGAILHGGGKAGKWAYDRYLPMFADDTSSALRAIKEVVGPEKFAGVIAALKSDKNPLTKGSAAEVAEPVGSTRFSALQNAVDEMQPDQAMARILSQREGRSKVLSDIADLEQPARQFRDDITAPMRERSMSQATGNTAKQMELARQLKAQNESGNYTQSVPRQQPLAPVAVDSTTVPPATAGLTNDRSVPNAVRSRYGLEGEKQLADTQASNYFPVKGQPRAPKRYAPQQEVLERVDPHIADAKVVESLAKAEKQITEAQIRGMTAEGIEAATPNAILRGIKESMGRPSVVGNPTMKRLMPKIGKEIEGMVRKDGTIDPEALYTYRKTGINTTISKAMKNADPATMQATVSQLGGKIRPLLDDVIDKAAGGGWKQYLKAYSKLSRPVDQGKVGKYLQEKFVPALSDEGAQRAPALATALRDSPTAAKRAGIDRPKAIEDILNPWQMKSIDALKADLVREASTKEMATRGSKAAAKALQPEDKTLANPLMREIMVTNAVIRVLSKTNQAAVEKEVARLMQRDPESGFSALIKAAENAAPEKRNILIKIMSKYPELERAVPIITGMSAGGAGGEF